MPVDFKQIIERDHCPFSFEIPPPKKKSVSFGLHTFIFLC